MEGTLLMPETTLPPSSPPPEPADPRARRVELVLSHLLRGGVIISLLVIITGTVLSFVHHPGYLQAQGDLPRLTQPGAVFPHTLTDVGHALQQGQGQAVVMVGLLLLIITPILRVAVSILAFIYERDYTFVLITSGVLLILLLSFVLGKLE